MGSGSGLTWLVNEDLTEEFEWPVVVVEAFLLSHFLVLRWLAMLTIDGMICHEVAPTFL